MPGAARKLRPAVVDHTIVVIDERSIEGGIADLVTIIPAAGRDQRHPQVIGGKTSQHLRIAPTNQALATLSIVREASGQARGREEVLRKRIHLGAGSRVVARLDVKPYRRPAILA